MVFPIHFQCEARLLKACFLFRSRHLWMHILCDLAVILNILYYQYREGLFEFVQLIVLDLSVCGVWVYCYFNFAIVYYFCVVTEKNFFVYLGN